MTWTCTTCGANWTDGQFTDDCKECGGGAMERGCLICDGRCGTSFSRMPMDSNDAREAHWMGSCKLPMDEQMEWMRRAMEDIRKRD